ncbi:hypothetical protein XACM_3321 [Xanthomonas euvesicatoria pv. citrumelo F1]|nr:hypothetical protein XACM_3321 [Xanthomonas euvesicatoria pv. citrumelo F1]PPU88608.1 hypothetical protein XaclCFBP3371_10105 [Xanthomonas euvesicatoria pv. citrumelonis]
MFDGYVNKRWELATPKREAAHRLRTTSRFYKTADPLSGAVSLPIAGPLAAWMPPSSPQGRVYGVSRER